MPDYIEIAIAIIGCFAVIIGVYKTGQHDTMNKNGYVQRDDCHRRIDDIKTDIRDLHAKINSGNNILHMIAGKLNIDL